MDTQESMKHGLNAAKANAADNQEEQQVQELSQKLGVNQAQQSADGMRYDYDDASDM